MHLSSTQIYEWTIGERRPGVEQHLQNCSSCREEVLQLQNGLLVFQRSAHQLAEEGPAFRPVKQQRLSWQWATAAAVAMGFALLPLFLNVNEARQDAQRAQDSLLLNQINARLSQSVPEPMEPLMKLMTDKEGDSQ